MLQLCDVFWSRWTQIWENRLRLSAPFVEQRFNPTAMKDEYPQRELSAAIIGPAMKVLNGLSRASTKRFMRTRSCSKLIAQGHHVEQRRFPVHYRGHLVGTLIPDILVDEKVIVDPKVVEAFTDEHIAQMLGYLAITELELALLLNFKFAKLRWKRVVRSRSADGP
jgi:GxxExxY protein